MESTKELRRLADHARANRCAGATVMRLLGNACKDYRNDDGCSACQEDADAAINALADRIEREHEEAMDALDDRLMPYGMQWPRFEGGEKVKHGDEFVCEESQTNSWGVGNVGKASFVKIYSGGTVALCSGNREHVFPRGHRVKRPKPVVLAADGLPIEVGQTLYHKADCRPLTVTGFGDAEDGETIVRVEGDYAEVRQYSVTHTPPDTQERIDEAAKMRAADYCISHGIEVWKEPNDKKTFVELMVSDLLRRQRELCEREAGGE